jgi:hypothetical protein
MSLVTPMETNPRDESRIVSPVFFHEIQPPNPVDGCTEQRLEVLVVFTDTPGTQAALQMAERLAQKLEAHIRLLFPYEVPYALPLNKPAVAVEFLERQMRNLAHCTKLDVIVQIYLCRDKKRALDLLLKPNSLVVVGGRKHWWPTAAEKLAQDLQKRGHNLLFAELR